MAPPARRLCPYVARYRDLGPRHAGLTALRLVASSLSRELAGVVDVTERILEVCRERSPMRPTSSYVLTDGATLPGVADASVDFVWSFDAFVHIAPLDSPHTCPRSRACSNPGGAR